ncbi:Nuclear transcription factor Y subunit A-8 [Chlorella vulgaris]
MASVRDALVHLTSSAAGHAAQHTGQVLAHVGSDSRVHPLLAPAQQLQLQQLAQLAPQCGFNFMLAPGTWLPTSCSTATPADSQANNSSVPLPAAAFQQHAGIAPLAHTQQQQQAAGSSSGTLQYVNEKQLACILRRRHKRQQQEAENKLPRVRKPYTNKAAHLQAMTRPRGSCGKFLSSTEIREREALEAALAGRTDARLGREPLLQMNHTQQQPRQEQQQAQ